ncbi:MAG TPA: M48 family metallopeptidase, partial [Thermoanaerobaculia bacterium]
QDAQIGYQSAVQVERQLPLVADSTVDAYVNRIGRRLAANAGGPAFDYRFRVVNASDINAFALPGGYVYINRGILESADSEGEVAGVLAHEIAHVALRHGTHQLSKAQATSTGLQILGGLLNGKVGPRTANVLNIAGGIGMNALFLKFTRDLESQADIRGAQILAASGYDPDDMISFFHELERVDRSKRTTWLSHHPAPPDRIARIEQESRMLGSGSRGDRTGDLGRVQTRLARMGDAPTMAQISRRSAGYRGR